MGVHLHSEADKRKANEAIGLLRRTFLIHVRRVHDNRAMEMVTDVIQRLPSLIGLMLSTMWSDNETNTTTADYNTTSTSTTITSNNNNNNNVTNTKNKTRENDRNILANKIANLDNNNNKNNNNSNNIINNKSNSYKDKEIK